MKKYEITNEVHPNHPNLKRIKALQNFGTVKEGELGGYIEKEKNLSQDGNAWVFENAQVFGNAMVFGSARVSGNAWVYEKAHIYGSAQVFGKDKLTNHKSLIV